MKTHHIILALALIATAVAYRVAAVFLPDISNFSPMMALAFCGAVYFRRSLLWLAPLAALTISDLWIDRYYATTYGYTWDAGNSLHRIATFVAAIGIGILVSRRRTMLTLFTGALGCSFLFYLVTNSSVWLTDPIYAKTAAGWWQAMTIGHPEFPPTLWFFRNTLAGDLIFTGIFAVAMSTATASVPAKTETA